MGEFMSNFTIFLNGILSGLSLLYNWFISTILGQIFIFICVILIFIFIIYKLINLGG